MTITVNGAVQTQARLRSAAKAVNKESLTRMREATILLERHLKQKLLTGSPGSSTLFGRTGASPPTLGSVSGHLRRSVTSAAFTANVGSAPVVVGTVGTPVLYAKTHEEGAVIHGNPYLRIPTRFAKTGAGVDRMAGISARNDPSLILVRSRAGNLWLARQPGKAAKVHGDVGYQKRARRLWRGRDSGVPRFWPGLVPMYLLVKQVRIPKRAPFAAALIQKGAEVRAILGEAAEKVVSIATGGTP